MKGRTVGGAGKVRADRRAACLRPAHLGESRLGLGVRHAEHLSEAEALGRTGKEEVLRHVRVSNDRVRAFMTLSRCHVKH